MKRGLGRIILSTLSGIAVFFAWRYFLNGDTMMEALAYGVSLAVMFPAMWFFGVYTSSWNADVHIRPRRDRIVIYIIVCILSAGGTLLYRFGVGESWKESLRSPLLAVAVAFLLSWIVYLIIRRKAVNRRRRETGESRDDQFDR